MPPVELTRCLKEDLAEFLIDNSYNHLLDAEEVPLHIIHGTADTLIPYEQALSLCGAIDNRVFATDVFDPLTSYDCGTASQVQLIQDADHALDLGLCLGEICPAGEFGSLTRDAVATAIFNSYTWLQQDRPVVIDDDPPIVADPPKKSGGAFSWFGLIGLLLLNLLRFVPTRNRQRQAT
jgi:hypothetical protein